MQLSRMPHRQVVGQFRPVGRIYGASLIEVLISIVIAAIALLALAGVNAASVRYTKMSQYRATATQLANDIGERMRANKGVAAKAAVVGPPAVAAVVATGYFVAGNYSYITNFSGQATKATMPTQTCDTGGSNCSPDEIAAVDLAQWRILVRDQLPDGSVYVVKQTAEVAADVWVAWRDPAVAADDSPTMVLECPTAMSTGDDSIRCSYFRINL